MKRCGAAIGPMDRYIYSFKQQNTELVIRRSQIEDQIYLMNKIIECYRKIIGVKNSIANRESYGYYTISNARKHIRVYKERIRGYELRLLKEEQASESELIPTAKVVIEKESGLERAEEDLL